MTSETHMLNDAVGHSVSLAALCGWLVGALPPIATLLAIIWYGLMINDWYQLRRDKRRAEALNHEKAQIKADETLASIKEKTR